MESLCRAETFKMFRGLVFICSRLKIGNLIKKILSTTNNWLIFIPLTEQLVFILAQRGKANLTDHVFAVLGLGGALWKCVFDFTCRLRPRRGSIFRRR